MTSFHKTETLQKNLNFQVEPARLELAYKGDANALFEIGKQAEHEQRFGLAKNFFRLASEQENQKKQTNILKQLFF